MIGRTRSRLVVFAAISVAAIAGAIGLDLRPQEPLVDLPGFVALLLVTGGAGSALYCIYMPGLAADATGEPADRFGPWACGAMFVVWGPLFGLAALCTLGLSVLLPISFCTMSFMKSPRAFWPPFVLTIAVPIATAVVFEALLPDGTVGAESLWLASSVVLWNAAMWAWLTRLSRIVARDRVERDRFCQNCGYPRDGLAGDVCPECGAPFTTPSNLGVGAPA